MDVNHVHLFVKIKGEIISAVAVIELVLICLHYRPNSITVLRQIFSGVTSCLIYKSYLSFFTRHTILSQLTFIEINVNYCACFEENKHDWRKLNLGCKPIEVDILEIIFKSHLIWWYSIDKWISNDQYNMYTS